ncbi:hypothetical protein BGZ57DRAFT_778841, partial [Hyaloscypha finlandica]
RVRHICQRDSWSDLAIDKETIATLTEYHNMMPELSQLISMFSSKRLAIEEAFSGPLLEKESEATSEFGYVMKYPECKTASRDGSKSWVIRQIGVYQQYFKSTGKSVWMFLHCQPNSSGQKLVTSMLENKENCISLQKHLVELHLLIFSFYLQNWREYMSFYETELLEKACFRALNLDIYSQALADGIQRQRGIHFISAHFSPLPAIFAHHKSIFRLVDMKLQSTIPFENRHRSQLSYCSSLVDSYAANTATLQGKCANLLQFVVDSIGINNQLTAQNQNMLMIRMAQTTVNDSASIRTITVVTLLYLPASFVATFFGMQFFQFQISKLWIFFGFSIILTVLTLLGWWWSVRRRRGSEETDGDESDMV